MSQLVSSSLVSSSLLSFAQSLSQLMSLLSPTLSIVTPTTGGKKKTKTLQLVHTLSGSSVPEQVHNIVERCCAFLDQLEEEYNRVDKTLLYAKLLRHRITIFTAELVSVLASGVSTPSATSTNGVSTQNGVSVADELTYMLQTGVCCEDEMITVIAIYHPHALRQLVYQTPRLMSTIEHHTNEWLQEAQRQHSDALSQVVAEISTQIEKKKEVQQLCKKFKWTKLELKQMLEEMEVEE